MCHYSAWANGVGPVEVVEIAAAGEESLVQVAGTTLHELGHVLAGWGAGHGAEWKQPCERLGLRRALAAGQCYLMTSMAGVGVKGGTSRGKGSGSRLRLWVCGCEKPVRVRVASDDFRAHCDACGQAFRQRRSV